MIAASSSAEIPYWRLSGFYFFYFAAIGTWIPFWPLYLHDLGFSAADIGYLSAVMMATKIVAPSVWGWFADRATHRMWVVRCGALLSLLIFLPLFSVTDFWSLAVIIAIYSFFWNAILPQFDVVTLSHLGQRFHYYSQIRVWGSIGFILLVVVLGWIFDVIAISWLPWFVALMLLGMALSSFTVVDAPALPGTRSAATSVLTILRQPPVLSFFLICFLMQISHGPYYTFFSVYLEGYGYSRMAVGLMWSLGVVAEVLVFMVMHRLLLRFRLAQILWLSLALAALRWYLIAGHADSLWWLVLAQLLHAATFGSFHAVSVEAIRRFFTGGCQGQGMALYSGFSFGLGGAIGAVISGWVWEYNHQLVFLLAAGMCVLAVLVAWLNRPFAHLETADLETAPLH